MISSSVAEVRSDDCADPYTPHLPPAGVATHAGYGSPCSIRSPCQEGMSCCTNANNRQVCEGKCVCRVLGNIGDNFSSDFLISRLFFEFGFSSNA